MGYGLCVDRCRWLCNCVVALASDAETRRRSPAPGSGIPAGFSHSLGRCVSTSGAFCCYRWFLGSMETRSRSEEHTSELQSLRHLVCRLLLEKKKKHIS